MADTPPICNYEGSDYQETFWEKGGRAYEDAVEAIALGRLLPKGGRLLLELGAGAGRHTSRYENFERIVLLDYSRSQLQLAQEHLGTGERFTYIAADIYRLPFVAGLFDTATMIRTIHHMTDPRKALDQLRRVMGRDGIFILEFANKHNLKSVLRYLLRRQYWNPFSPDPVEFAPLNFNFHPSTMRAWLQLCGFAVERQLTVSHFRVDILKKLLPLGLLVWMDSIAQRTGNWFQWTPSVFMCTRAVGESTLQDGGEGFYRCPECGKPIADTPPTLVCEGCGKTYPVEDGIYNFRGDTN